MKSYAALEATNVDSTLELLRVAVGLPHTRYIYVAGGGLWDSQAQEEKDVAEELSIPGAIGYNQSKFVAEAVVKRPAQIFIKHKSYRSCQPWIGDWNSYGRCGQCRRLHLAAFSGLH